MLDFSSGYVRARRRHAAEPGRTRPWRVHQNYFKDLAALGHAARIDGGDGVSQAG